jgi:UDP-glucose 4-epimerase
MVERHRFPAAPGQAPARRLLLIGPSTPFRARLAETFERLERIEAVLAVDPNRARLGPTRPGRGDAADQRSSIERIVTGERIDTVVDTHLLADSTLAPARQVHETNVIDTEGILAACGGPRSPVRRLVFKSSAHYYGCERDDPAFFTEAMRRSRPPRTRVERDVVEAEVLVSDYAARHPGVSVAVLRCAEVLGPGIESAWARLLAQPAIPAVLGFDPRCQFVHSDDVVRALGHVVLGGRAGIFNVAADGVLSLSEVAALLGRPIAPVLSPLAPGLLARPLRLLGIRIPDEMVGRLRLGGAMDNRLLQADGFAYGYTCREAVQKLAEGRRRDSVQGRSQPRLQ